MQTLDDTALRPRGRPRKDAFPWVKQIQLAKGDASKINRSECKTQYVFSSLACRRGHLRIMLPCSADEKSLTCKICNDDDFLTSNGMSAPSAHERDVYHHLGAAIMSPRYWATEAAIFIHTGDRSVSNCKADLVFFDEYDVSPDNLRKGLAVFIDGEGHFAWLHAKGTPTWNAASRQHGACLEGCFVWLRITLPLCRGVRHFSTRLSNHVALSERSFWPNLHEQIN
jgi:hypothetical protein